MVNTKVKKVSIPVSPLSTYTTDTNAEPASARQYVPREQRMLSEWLAKEYPNDTVITRVKMGTPHPSLISPGLSGAELRMVGVWRRWVDALVLKKDRVILVEASVLPAPGKIAQLALYEELLPHTPELGKFAKFPVEKVLLSAAEDPVLTKIAKRYGIKVVFYRPTWVVEYLRTLSPRSQRPPLTFLPVKA